jgi:predicted nucleic acid-binding protein
VKPERLLIDTGAIYALVVRTDAHHEPAKRFLASWLDKKGEFTLIDLVFAEIMTLLRARLRDPAVAVRVGRELRTNPIYHWLTLSREAERATWSIFHRFDDKDWSYTDCALLAVARSLANPALANPGVFSFDRRLGQMSGVDRLP